MKYIQLFVLLVFLCVTSNGQVSADLLQEEINLGRNYRNALLSSRPELKGIPEVEIGQGVFARLLATSIAQRGYQFPFRLTFLDSSDINASSYMGGEIFADGGLVRLLKESPGLWAAVLGHEIAHTKLRHHFNAFLRQWELQQQSAELRRRAAAGDQSANWALLGLGIGGKLVDLKLSRNEEHEADRLGLFMMAEAGYHPDFALTCYRRLAFKIGDQSKAGAFFATHPRWETREQRALKAYDEALAIFFSRWPDPEKSPGGLPPAIASLSNISVEKDELNKAAVIKANINVRNIKNKPVAIHAEFYHNDKPVPSAIDKFKSGDGFLASGVKGYPQSLNENTTIEIRIPSAAIGIKQRKLKTYLVIFGPDSEVLYASKDFIVNFPGH